MEEYLLVLKFIGLLLLVALLAYLVIRFGLRRLQPAAGRGYLRIIQKTALDLKGDRLLVLIQIGERVLLLGSAQGNVSVLAELSAEELSLPNENVAGPEGESLFPGLLNSFRRKMKS